MIKPPQFTLTALRIAKRIIHAICAPIPAIILTVLVLLFVGGSVFHKMVADLATAVKENIVPVTVLTAQSIEMRATAYTANIPYNKVAKDGSPAIPRGFAHIGGYDWFTVSVDPKVIPLGSLLWIEDIGIGMATDTGSDIIGNEIDICFDFGTNAIQFGVKTVRVYIMHRGPMIK